MPRIDLLAPGWKDVAKIEREIMLGVLRSMSGFDPGLLLDVGAGDSGYGGLFSARCRRLITLDVEIAACPSVVGSALTLPFHDQRFDTVVSTQTLEHLPDPVMALGEMKRVLKVGGRLLLSAPQTWPMHLVPHDYYRFTRYGLEWMLARTGFVVEHIEACGGAFATIGQYLALGVFHIGTHARHSRTRRFWRRLVMPLISRIALRLERWRSVATDNVLDWVVLARRP